MYMPDYNDLGSDGYEDNDNNCDEEIQLPIQSTAAQEPLNQSERHEVPNREMLSQNTATCADAVEQDFLDLLDDDWSGNDSGFDNTLTADECGDYVYDNMDRNTNILQD